MSRTTGGLVIFFCAATALNAAEEPEGLLDRFLTAMRQELRQLPDYVCTQSIERLSRADSDRPWERVDTLKLEVALVGEEELYARPGGRRFDRVHASSLASRGTTSTGRFGSLARHLFLGQAAAIKYRGEAEHNGRAAHEYDYDVAPERSNYRLSSGGKELPVGFQGSFLIDAETSDLVRLDVQAYDIPEALGISEANSTIVYRRTSFGENQVLLPIQATLSMISAQGAESLNRTSMTGCKRYVSESTIQFAGEAAPSKPRAVEAAEEAKEPESTAAHLPAGALVEIQLEAAVDLAAAKVGDRLRARLAKPILRGERVVAAAGAEVSGRIVRLERETVPFPMVEIGVVFDEIEAGANVIEFQATMEDAGPSAGLLKQAKRMDPTFARKRTARMDILVREVQRGQGILVWDARKGAIPKGFRMKWRIGREQAGL